MKLFKNKRMNMDERIINSSNKIYKEVYILVIIIVLISIIIKLSINGLDYKSVISEFLILIIPSFYYVIRIIQLGIYSDSVEIHDRKSKISMNIKTILIGLGTGIIMALYFGIRSSIVYGDESNRVWYFFLVFITSFMIYCPLLAGGIALTNYIANNFSKKVNSTKDEDQ